MHVFYGAGHAQFALSELRLLARLAEEVGFDGIAGSDHFQKGDETQLELMEEELAVILWLWSGEILDGGRRFRMKAARLYTRPESLPPLYALAFHNRAATAAARHGDGPGVPPGRPRRSFWMRVRRVRGVHYFAALSFS